MDFFKYASFAGNFVNTLWLQLLIGGLCFATVFIFEGIALYTIAKREGYSKKWMAFLPFLNTYYIGVCAQKNKFYNIDTKKIGLFAAIFEFILFALYIVYYVACYLVIDYAVEERITQWGISFYEYNLYGYPQNLAWAAWIYNHKFILKVLSLIYSLLEIVILICFFQTYACRRYVIFTITSILFPIQGLLFFAVRNNKGINYKDFLRVEQARQYAMYHRYQQQQQNFDHNPYERNGFNRNPYNGNPYGDYNADGTSRQTPPEDPFGGLGGTNGTNASGGAYGQESSPFDEFD